MSTSWPEAILHLDADAFFASVTQAVNPHLKGKPVVSGMERGIATAVSYEAKALGVTRGMPCWEIKKQFPTVIIAHSDYRLYHLFSNKIFSIMKKYSPIVEVYSVDEGFADLKGLIKPLNMTYEQIGRTMKDEIENSLGITVSIGISTTKSLAKIAANLNKPSGLCVFSKEQTGKLLKKTDISKVWGIGYRSAPKLRKFNINTAYDYANRPESFIKKFFPKPFYEIWLELNGISIFKVDSNPKREYKSITKSHTVTPATNDKNVLWARILSHVENAFLKARIYNYNVGKIFIYLKTQKFTYRGIEIKLSEKTPYPIMIRRELREAFEKIYKPNVLYRTTGATIYGFTESNSGQIPLFSERPKLIKKAEKIYPLFDNKKVTFGTSLFETQKRAKSIKFSIPFFQRIKS
jgi:DNA polymerase-4/DNA polymerase V